MSRPKLRYAHQGGENPPLIIVHGSIHVPQTYRRYLENTFREVFELKGTPLRVEFRTGHNPYAGKKTPLTEEEARRAHRHIAAAAATARSTADPETKSSGKNSCLNAFIISS